MLRASDSKSLTDEEAAKADAEADIMWLKCVLPNFHRERERERARERERERERVSRGELTDRERDRERVTFFARRTCERVSECVNAWVSE